LTDNGDSINISTSNNETFLNLTTTDDTTTILNLPTIPINKSWFFEMYVIARAGTTNRAWKLEGVVQDSSGTQSIVGSVIKSDYQRNTSDIASLDPWDPMYAYSANDSVEYNLVEYTANFNVQSIQNPAADTTNWSATYIGWNVSVVVNGSNQIEVRVKGEPSLTVNWSVKHVYIQV
jgi:hypothetical protein